MIPSLHISIQNTSAGDGGSFRAYAALPKNNNALYKSSKLLQSNSLEMNASKTKTNRSSGQVIDPE